MIELEAETLSIDDLVADESHPAHDAAVTAKRIGKLLEAEGIAPWEALPAMALMVAVMAEIMATKAQEDATQWVQAG